MRRAFSANHAEIRYKEVGAPPRLFSPPFLFSRVTLYLPGVTLRPVAFMNRLCR